NTHVREGLTLKGIKWAFSFPGYDYWHPLTWVSHMLDCHLYGLMPGMHHQINVILHILNSMLLFLVFKRMTGAVWKSAFVAALFAVHPLNVESVAWVAERKNVLSTFFWLLTMLIYSHYSQRPSFYKYLMIFFVFALGLMSKPMLATLPFVLLLLDYWPLRRFELGHSYGYKNNQKSMRSGFRWPLFLRLILEKIPLLALSIAGIFLSSIALHRLGIVIPTASVPMKLRVANALVSYFSYINKMVWPHNLAVYYPYPKILPLWQVAGSGVLLIFISVMVFRTIRSKPYLTVGWLWYVGTLVPAIGLVQAGLWPAVADRFAYVPLIGLFLIIAWGVPDLAARWCYRKLKLAALAAALLVNFMVTTWIQVGYWRNSITLFKRTLDVTENNYIAHHKLGEALAAEDRIAAAIRHYSEALQIKSDFFASHLNLGIVLKREGKLDDAIRHFSKALRIKPDSAEAHNELGISLKEQVNFDGAIRHYHEALRIKSDYADAHNNIGVVLALQGNDEKAIYHFRESLRIDSKNSDAYFNLGKIYSLQGKIEDAIRYYREALHYNPNMIPALYNLSWITAIHEDEKFRDGEEAVKLAERLCKITEYNQPLALDALAAAYAETGRFDAAVLTVKRALELALQDGPKDLAQDLKKRLEGYQAGRPYRQQAYRKKLIEVCA
ncbi:MAG: tetratricopeptide repeat protein, partial [Desulfobacterales bacterium]